SVLVDVRPVVDFGIIETGAVKTEIFRPVSELPEPLRIVEIESVGDGFEAKILEDGKALGVTTAPNAGWGTHWDFVKLKTNSTLQKEIWVRLKANVHGAVIASVDPVDFSVVRQGSGAEEVVLIEAKSHVAINVESVRIDGAKFSYTIEACPERVGCARLKLKLDDGQPIGQIFGKAWVKFKNEKNLLPINIRGLVISKDQRIVELPPRVTSGGDSTPLAKSNLVEEIKAATTETLAAPVATTPPGKGPLLKWSVTHEEGDLHGYIIYRSDDKDGRFVLINDSIIKTLGSGSREAVDYQWRDNSATSGKSYWYYVGLIYNDGHKGKLTEPQKVVAK
ncbi:MAG TPA: hypothetical protein VLC97_12680, partial [Rhodanobacteraceae bacterium]|nr:hypothetical protein [Rhodanobacteraceae bacterium]